MDSISPPVKFTFADSYRAFTLFPRLPLELRQEIWKHAISAPRMHFVKLDSKSVSWRWVSLARTQTLSAAANPGAADETDEVAAEVKHEVTPRVMHGTQLVPIAPNKRSDISSHHDLQKQLRILSLTCRESRAVVKSLSSRPGTMRLGNDSILSMANSSDIIFLEYSPSELYETGCALAIDPACPDLSLIRRVAVRFSHHWQNKTSSSVCIFCGQVHNSLSRRPVFPTHLYHFLARHLPNLQEFFFVDYLIVRKQGIRETKHASTAEPRRQGHLGDHSSLAIKCGNRTYYEANPDEWQIKPQVLSLKSWLEDRFVRYANMSRLSTHRNPDKVRFGILACEHSIQPPLSLPSNQAPSQSWSLTRKRGSQDSARRRAEHQRLALFRSQQSSESLHMAPPSTTDAPHTIDVNVPFVFGNSKCNSFFEFTFRVPFE